VGSCCSSFQCCVVLCFYFSSSCVLYSQCCQCLWIVLSVFLNYWPTYIFLIWTYKYFAFENKKIITAIFFFYTILGFLVTCGWTLNDQDRLEEGKSGIFDYTITALEGDQYEILWSRAQQYWTRRSRGQYCCTLLHKTSYWSSNKALFNYNYEIFESFEILWNFLTYWLAKSNFCAIKNILHSRAT
jgi:hypothetical protein